MDNIQQMAAWRWSVKTVCLLATMLQLFLGAAGAQPPPQFTCTMNAGVPPITRADSASELVSDMVGSCTGGIAGNSGLYTINVSLNTPVVRAGEALLLVNDPPAGSQTIGGNVFQGAPLASNNLTFTNVMLADPGTNTLVLRVTNVRVAAYQMGTTFPSNQVDEFIEVSGGSGIMVNNPHQTVSFNQLGVKAILTGQSSFPICTPVNTQLVGNPAATGGQVTFTVTFTEGSTTSFRIRNTAGGGSTPPAPQAVPGFPYNTETGFYNPAFPSAGGLNTAGLATQGTRLALELSGLPVGVSLYGTVTPMAASASIDARLTGTDDNGAGAYHTVDATTTVMANSTTVGIAPVQVTAGHARLVWEILNSDPTLLESLSFGVVVAFSATPPGSAPIRLGFAPAGTDTTSSPTFVEPAASGNFMVNSCGPNDPDLVVSAITAAGTVHPGGFLPVHPSITNMGGATTNINIDTSVRLFSDSLLTIPVPISEGKCTAPGGLASGQTVTCTSGLSIPNNLKPGSYWLGAMADSGNVVAESVESNNTRASFLQVLPGPPPPSKPGIFRQGFLWVLDANGNHAIDSSSPGQDYIFGFGGLPGDIPVYGDWNGDGRTKVGFVRNGNQWFLDYNGNQQFDGPSFDRVYTFGGLPGDVPVVGDWTGDGRSKIGVFRGGVWILDLNGNGIEDPAEDAAAFGYGGFPGDVPVAGDWTGAGKSNVGVFRQGFLWVLDTQGDHTNGAVFPYGGIAGDIPVVGDWTGTGVTQVGILRQDFLWVLDANGNRAMDDGPNFIFPFGGYPGPPVPDVPVVGKW